MTKPIHDNHVFVWSNTPDPDTIDKDFIRAEYGPEYANDDTWLAQYAYDCNHDYCDDLCKEFEELNGLPIIAIWNRQVWNGRYFTYSLTHHGMLDILMSGGGNYDAEFYLNRFDLRGSFHHHDGCHDVLFRVVKDKYDPLDVMDRLERVKDYEPTHKQYITNYTRTLRPYFVEKWGIK